MNIRSMVEAESRATPGKLTPLQRAAVRANKAETTAAAKTLTPDEADELAECERVIERGLRTLRDVGTALRHIRDARLYRLEHPTFETYCARRWGFTRARAHQLIDAAAVVEVLSTNVDAARLTEGTVRPLTKLRNAGGSIDKAAIRLAWTIAAQEAGEKPVTARHVAAAVAEVRPEAVKRTSPPRDEQAIMDRLAGEFLAIVRDWPAAHRDRLVRMLQEQIDVMYGRP